MLSWAPTFLWIPLAKILAMKLFLDLASALEFIDEIYFFVRNFLLGICGLPIRI
jgi:hypothetical protein